MNSCLYEATVFHRREEPSPNAFLYRIFVFGIDLGELDLLAQKLRLFRYNRLGLFSFFDKDHLQYHKSSTLDNLKAYYKACGGKGEIQRAVLITNCRVLGYVFNPVSFYFCYDSKGQLIAGIPEVGNTFGEIKPYIGYANTRSKHSLAEPDILLITTKNFYVSPFLPLDSEFEFRLNEPGENLQIAVYSNLHGKRMLTTTFQGKKIPFTDSYLLKLFFLYPLVTVKVIGAIHWQALRLLWKRVPFIRKKDNPESQTGVPIGEVSRTISH